MSTESTARTPLPYRLVRLWVSTIVEFCIPFKVGFVERRVVSREIDFSGHPRGGWVATRLHPGTCDRPARIACRRFRNLRTDPSGEHAVGIRPRKSVPLPHNTPAPAP